VENIDEIDFGNVAKNVDFTTKHDHSKWAVSYARSTGNLCDSDRLLFWKGAISFWTIFAKETAERSTHPDLLPTM
jgi:hypothetical protein